MNDIERGEQAKRLLENDLYVEAFEAVKGGIIQKWQDCPMRDREGQHELKLMLKCLLEVQGYIEQVWTTGKFAAIQLDQEKRISKVREHFPA